MRLSLWLVTVRETTAEMWQCLGRTKQRQGLEKERGGGGGGDEGGHEDPLV